ncbi:MAG: PTS sugar transporter subunit IIA [Desulfobacterales bacterium]|nr:PTS sugar transporter subunit IIA [Desulfobacterales bacterium]
MKIWKHLSAEHIFLGISIPDKNSVFQFVADICKRDHFVKEAAEIYNGMLAREEMASTGIGKGIGLPHTTNPNLDDAHIFLIRPEKPVDFDALDNAPVDIILALLIPENETTLHLQILAGLSRLCKEPKFLAAIRNAEDVESLREEIINLEEKMAIQ